MHFTLAFLSAWNLYLLPFLFFRLIALTSFLNGFLRDGFVRKHRKNSLELIGWTVAVERNVIGSRQASQAALRVEQGWCKNECEERARFAAMCVVERNFFVNFSITKRRSATQLTQGYLPAGGYQ